MSVTKFIDSLDEGLPLKTVFSTVSADVLSSSSFQASFVAWLQSRNELQPSRKYLLSVLKEFVRIINDFESNQCELDSAEGDTFVQDEILEEMFRLQAIVSSEPDDEDQGVLLYRVRGLDPKVPVAIKRSHNQVGTKVWSAGLVLAEYFQHELGSDSIMTSEGFKALELGAGVGITALLWGACLLQSDVQHWHICATDYAVAVMELLEKNVDLLATVMPSTFPLHSRMSSWLLDWQNLSSEDIGLLSEQDFIFAADCNYSPSLNSALTTLFTVYFTERRKRQQCSESCPDSLHSKQRIQHLLMWKVPFALIACTRRNEETYSHFLSTLSAEPSLRFWILTDEVHGFLAGKEMYHVPDRLSVEFICVIPSL